MAASSIMIVDDDDEFRETLHDMFVEEGYDVTVARNGQEAVDRFSEKPVDIVITDILMPEKEGIETIFELRREYGLKNIIAMSGGGRTGNAQFLETAKRLGVSQVFQKPIDLDELVRHVRSLPAGRR